MVNHSQHNYVQMKQIMKENKSLEYRIKRLERLIRNHRAVKNEAKIASVGRKMFAWNTSADSRSGINRR